MMPPEFLPDPGGQLVRRLQILSRMVVATALVPGIAFLLGLILGVVATH